MKLIEVLKSFFRTRTAGESKPLPEPIYVNWTEGTGGSGGSEWTISMSGGSSNYDYIELINGGP